MALFHRRSRGSDEADGEPRRADPKGSPSEPTGRAGPPASKGTADEPVPPPSTSPPPHPQRSPGLSAGPATQRFTTCFVCGSTLNAGACPTCKIAWVE